MDTDQKLKCDQNAKGYMYIKFISTDKNNILEQMTKSLLENSQVRFMELHEQNKVYPQKYLTGLMMEFTVAGSCGWTSQHNARIWTRTQILSVLDILSLVIYNIARCSLLHTICL